MSVFDFIHLLHGARGGESQTNRMCMQVSVSMSVLSVFVLSAFLCLFTALQVQFICRHRASSLFYMFLDDPGVCVLADYDPFCSRSLRPCLREFLDSILVDRLHPRAPTTSARTHALYTLATAHFSAARKLDTCAHTSPPRNPRSTSHHRYCDLCSRLLRATPSAT